jgi:hypothetical protein
MSDDGSTSLLDRRRFVLGAAGAVTSAGVAQTLLSPASGAAATTGRVVTPPTPIPGGIELAPGLVIHVFGPGDPAVTLPFSGVTLQGFDVEPITATDFNGSFAVAYHAGTVEGSDGKTYNLETDLRAFDGEYVANGSVHRGSFAFI